MNVTKTIGLAAIAGLLIAAAPGQRAQAMSLSNPGMAAAVQDDASRLTTEVHWHHHWHHHHRWHHHYWHRHHWHHRHWHHRHWHHW